MTAHVDHAPLSRRRRRRARRDTCRQEMDRVIQYLLEPVLDPETNRPEPRVPMTRQIRTALNLKTDSYLLARELGRHRDVAVARDAHATAAKSTRWVHRAFIEPSHRPRHTLDTASA